MVYLQPHLLEQLHPLLEVFEEETRDDIMKQSKLFLQDGLRVKSSSESLDRSARAATWKSLSSTSTVRPLASSCSALRREDFKIGFKIYRDYQILYISGL